MSRRSFLGSLIVAVGTILLILTTFYLFFFYRNGLPIVEMILDLVAVFMILAGVELSHSGGS